MADGPNGVSGQSVAVDVDRANRTDKDPVPTPGRWTVGEIAKDMLERLADATLGDLALNPPVSFNCQKR